MSDWLMDIVFPLFFGVIVLAVLCVIVLLPLICWWSSEIEAKMWNQKYGTTYSAKDFFFAGDSIKNYFNSGEQKTLNINGLK